MHDFNHAKKKPTISLILIFTRLVSMSTGLAWRTFIQSPFYSPIHDCSVLPQCMNCCRIRWRRLVCNRRFWSSPLTITIYCMKLELKQNWTKASIILFQVSYQAATPTLKWNSLNNWNCTRVIVTSLESRPWQNSRLFQLPCSNVVNAVVWSLKLTFSSPVTFQHFRRALFASLHRLTTNLKKRLTRH